MADPASREQIKQRILDKTWFYRFELPDGSHTKRYEDGALDPIHDTRLRMLDASLAQCWPDGVAGRNALDIACHQGYFSVQLAKRGFAQITAVDARADHIEDVKLITAGLDEQRIEAKQCDVHALSVDAVGGPFDLVLCFGLLYHLENPIGALRRAREMCKGLCVVETQVVPNMSGNVDWGSYRYVKPLMGSFGIIDETYETHGMEASVTGICLAPSTEGLIWIMEKVGFKDVQLLPCPDDGYEQLRFGKRVMVSGRV